MGGRSVIKKNGNLGLELQRKNNDHLVFVFQLIFYGLFIPWDEKHHEKSPPCGRNIFVIFSNHPTVANLSRMSLDISIAYIFQSLTKGIVLFFTGKETFRKVASSLVGGNENWEN